MTRQGRDQVHLVERHVGREHAHGDAGAIEREQRDDGLVDLGAVFVAGAREDDHRTTRREHGLSLGRIQVREVALRLDCCHVSRLACPRGDPHRVRGT